MCRPVDRTYNFIKKNILDGKYQPSEQLKEYDIAKEIGVSRNTVKKALLKLQYDNLINIQENKGATVKSYNVEQVMNYFDIRRSLETIVIETVVKNITEKEIKELESILSEMNKSLNQEDYENYSVLNRNFHNFIYKTSDNQEAVQMIQRIKNQLLRIHIRTSLINGRNKSSLQEHKEIVSALKERDKKAAKNAIYNHISNIRNVINDYHQLLL